MADYSKAKQEYDAIVRREESEKMAKKLGTPIPKTSLENSMTIDLTIEDKLKIDLAQAQHDLTKMEQVAASALASLQCAGKGALKDKAVQATLAILKAK